MASHFPRNLQAPDSEQSIPLSLEAGLGSAHRPAPQNQNAPTYSIPNRDIAAVEIPAVVKNIDRTVAAFGRVSSFDHVRSQP